MEALNSESSPGLPLTPKQEQDIQQRVKAIAWTGKIHPKRPKCLHRSLVLHHWLSQQGLKPQLEIGWQGTVGHAWITYRGDVLNDRQDVAEVTPRLTKVAAKTSF